MGREAWAGDVGDCFLVVGCAETANVNSRHESDVRYKSFLANSDSGFTGILFAGSLRILRRGRWLGRIGILLNFVSFHRLLRTLRLLGLELQDHGYFLFRFSHAMEPPIDDS